MTMNNGQHHQARLATAFGGVRLGRPTMAFRPHETLPTLLTSQGDSLGVSMHFALPNGNFATGDQNVMSIKRIRNAHVLRFDESGRVELLENHDIIVDGGWIRAIRPTGCGGAEGMGPPEDDFDASNCVAIPGLVNVHQHLFQSLTRVHKPVQDAKLFTWLTTLYNIWAKYGYRELKLAATIALGEMMLSGCTCSTDMHYLFPRGSDLRLDAVFDAAESLGIRMVAGRGCMTLGKSKGGLPPDEICETDDEALRDFSRVLDTCHDPRPGAMRQISLQPCAPFNVTLDIMRESLALARQHKAVVQTHLAETHDENDYCLEVYGCRPMALMERLGWLGDDVSFAHCVTLNADEVALMAATGTGVAHCPSANMRLGSGIAPISAMHRAGVTVGIGVDGSSSNDGMHMLAEGRLAILAQRALHGPAALTAEDGLSLLTRGGARLLKRPELGNLAQGFAADVALWRLDTVEMAGAAAQDPLGALMLANPGRAAHVMIHGQWTVRDHRIVSCDMQPVIAEANTLVRAHLREPIADLARRYPPVL